jgi:hypothetical protein
MKSKRKMAGMLVLALVAAAVLGGVVMMLWNAVLPGLFPGVRSLDYPHALGLLILSRILFGGFRGHGRGGQRHWGHWDKWQGMTAEEREQFLRAMPERYRKGCP